MKKDITDDLCVLILSYQKMEVYPGFNVMYHRIDKITAL